MATADPYTQPGARPSQDVARAGGSEPGIAELLTDLLADAQQLVHKEFELARAETMNEIGKLRQAAIGLGIGIGLASVGLILLVLMLVHLLVALTGIALWVSYLIVGAIAAVIGGVVLMSSASKLKEISPVPQETVESLRKDAEWIKEQNPSSKT